MSINKNRLTVVHSSYRILLSNRLNEPFIHTVRENLKTIMLYERNQTGKNKHFISLEEANNSIKENKSRVF